jgi:N-acetylmuramoyl-L-alanine amidase
MSIGRVLILSTWTIAAATNASPQRSGNTSPCSVAIDIGHSKSAPGAISSRGIGEFFFNRNIAHRLLDRLHGSSAVRAFILEDEGKDLPLKERTEAAKSIHAEFLISIHHDSVQPSYLSSWIYEGVEHRYSDRFHGYSLFFSRKNPHPQESFEFARYVGSSLLKSRFIPTLHHAEKIEGESRVLADTGRGIYIFDDLIILKSAAMPAVLLECGVIVNRDEEKHLSDGAWQDELVKAVATGIEQACAQHRRTGS